VNQQKTEKHEIWKEFSKPHTMHWGQPLVDRFSFVCSAPKEYAKHVWGIGIQEFMIPAPYQTNA